MNDFTCAGDNAAWRNSPEFAAFQKKTNAQSKRIASKNTADGFRRTSAGPVRAYAQGRAVSLV